MLPPRQRPIEIHFSAGAGGLDADLPPPRLTPGDRSSIDIFWIPPNVLYPLTRGCARKFQPLQRHVIPCRERVAAWQAASEIVGHAGRTRTRSTRSMDWYVTRSLFAGLTTTTR